MSGLTKCWSRYRMGMTLMFVTLLASFLCLQTPIGTVKLEEDAAPYLTLGTLMLCVGVFVLSFGTARTSVVIISLLAATILGGAVAYGEVRIGHVLEAGLKTLPQQPTAAQVRVVLPYIASAIAFFAIAPAVEELAKLMP